MKTPDTINGKTPEEIKKGILCDGPCNECPYRRNIVSEGGCSEAVSRDTIDYIQQLESSRWELLEELSTAYYGKQMYGLNDDGTVYSRYSCDTMSFEQAVNEFRRLISDE